MYNPVYLHIYGMILWNGINVLQYKTSALHFSWDVQWHLLIDVLINEFFVNPAAEKFPNLTCFFEHKLTSCNLKTGQLEFLQYVANLILYFFTLPNF